VAEHENPFAVRWDTEHEEEDLSRMIGAVGDDFAIYLDRYGWQITLKSACKPKISCPEDLWPMNQKTTATPVWATDKHCCSQREEKIAYQPCPSAAEVIFDGLWVGDLWVTRDGRISRLR
jgi:hypothetical protein